MSTPDHTPQDSPARARALDPEASFAVTAPAGSGKTGLLTQRLLTLLERVEYPEEILAITFTNKAASEMQERILEALTRAAYEPEPSAIHERTSWQLARRVLDRDREHQWQLLSNPSRLRIQTIDGLCRRIAMQLPFSSTLGATPAPLEDADGAYREAVRNLFLSADDKSDTSAALARLFAHMDNHLPALEGLFVNLLRKREQWLGAIYSASTTHARQRLEATLQSIITEALEREKAALALFAGDLCQLLDTAASYLRDTDPQSPLAALAGITQLPDTRPEDLPRWQLIADFLLTQKGQLRSRLTVKEGFPGGPEGKAAKARFADVAAALLERDADAAERLHALRLLPAPHYTDTEWYLLADLTCLLPRLAAELRLVFQRLGATDFTEITLAALEALGESESPTELALKLDYRIRHILVDEFQDTALPQLQLLERLTAGWQPGDGRTLFIVGDGMQSCYGFRNANVGLFLDARRQGIGSVPLEPVELCVNFRSQAGVVDWVNHTFHAAFPAEDDISRGAVRYTPSVAFAPALAEPAVSLDLAAHYSDSEREEDPQLPDLFTARQQEAEQVVARVQAALAADPAGTIAILGRTRSHLSEIIAALTRAGLSFVASNMDALSSRPAIVDLRSLTRALLCPEDRIAWLSILRAPWCGLDLHDLHCLANWDTEIADARGGNFIWQLLNQPPPALSAAGKQILVRVAPLLLSALAERQRKPLRDWVRGLWLALGGPACLARTSEHEDVAQYFALLERFERAGQIADWEAFNRAVDTLYAAPMAGGDERLQVMTLHKSKGLEFDTVIIAGLDRASRGQDKSLLLWRQRLSASGEPQLLLGPLAKTGDDPGALYQYLKSEQKQQDDYELTRLLYVGCTRAIKRLHLSACIAAKTETPVSELSARGMLASIWSGLSGEAQLLPLPDQRARPAGQQPRDSIVRLRPEWQAPAAIDNPLLAHLRGKTAAGEDNIPERESAEQRLLRHTGTVIHRVLEELASGPLPTEEDAFIAQGQLLWRNYLLQQQLAGSVLPQALARIERAVRATLKDPEGRWLLDSHHLQAQSEAEFFTLADDGNHRRHVVDRTFVYEGARWIVDYKTAEPPAGVTAAEFLQTQVESYRSQLARYRALFTHAPEPVIVALYFPLLEGEKRLVPVDIAEPSLAH